MSQTRKEKGWYRNENVLRYWDGYNWTSRTLPLPDNMLEAGSASAATGPQSRMSPPAPTPLGAHQPSYYRAMERVRKIAATDWKDRLPEIAAYSGAALMSAATIGFLSSTWEQLPDYGKGAFLVGAAAALTLFASRLWQKDVESKTAPVLWSSATGLGLFAIYLILRVPLGDYTRIAIAIAGIVAVGHGFYGWLKKPDSIALQLTALAAAVVAAGPPGSGLSASVTFEQLLAAIFVPIGGFFALDAPNSYMYSATAHLAIAAIWLTLIPRIKERPADLRGPRYVAQAATVSLSAYSALQFNAMTNRLGAVAALLVVLGLFGLGVAMQDVTLKTVGGIGLLGAGIKVLTALFSGEIAVTIAVFAAGLALSAYSYQKSKGHKDTKADDTQSADEADTPAPAEKF